MLKAPEKKINKVYNQQSGKAIRRNAIHMSFKDLAPAQDIEKQNVKQQIAKLTRSNIMPTEVELS